MFMESRQNNKHSFRYYNGEYDDDGIQRIEQYGEKARKYYAMSDIVKNGS